MIKAGRVGFFSIKIVSIMSLSIAQEFCEVIIARICRLSLHSIHYKYYRNSILLVMEEVDFML